MSYNNGESTEQPFSLLQGESFFLNKILGRKSSTDNSCRFSFYRRAGEVPFKWEKQPGKPKDLPEKESFPPPPPVHPPQAMRSCTDVQRPKRGSRLRRIWLWRKNDKKKYYNGKKVRGKVEVGDDGGEFDGLEFSKSDVEFMNSSCGSSSSSSSSSLRSVQSIAKGLVKWPF